MITGLLVILALVFILPFIFKKVEKNLEYFLFIMGVSATIISGSLSFDLVLHILSNSLLYFITIAVLIAGLIFKYSAHKIKGAVDWILKKISLEVFVCVVIIVIGLISSLITAIISALILVEVLHNLPINHRMKIKLSVVSCFSIGLGSALTPIGEPLSTIVTSKLNADFMFLLNLLGWYIIPTIILLGIAGLIIIKIDTKKNAPLQESLVELSDTEEINFYEKEEISLEEEESIKTVIIRALKIFVFVLALELLGSGFKPIIDNYIISLDSRLLYWINMSSAVLDNATLAAAEVTTQMSLQQLKAVLMGLLLSGGMLIPGNIPNIITAGKLGIKSKEWAKYGAPIGAVLLVAFFVIIFFIG